MLTCRSRACTEERTVSYLQFLEIITFRSSYCCTTDFYPVPIFGRGVYNDSENYMKIHKESETSTLLTLRRRALAQYVRSRIRAIFRQYTNDFYTVYFVSISYFCILFIACGVESKFTKKCVYSLQSCNI